MARWGDLEDEVTDAIVEGPNEEGVTTVTEYYRDEGGKLFRRVKRVTKGRKSVLRRLHLKKFGDADGAEENRTLVSQEQVFIEKPGSGERPIVEKNKMMMIRCRTCGSTNHATHKCPLSEFQKANPPEYENKDASTSKYVPPKSRAGAKKYDDENKIKVYNLSEDAREEDVVELFRPFGKITSVRLMTDRVTGASRGFGFVKFSRREEAELAMKKLDGYGYDNLILRLAWADE